MVLTLCLFGISNLLTTPHYLNVVGHKERLDSKMDDCTITFDDLNSIAEEFTEEDRKPKTKVIYKDKDLVHISPLIPNLQQTRWNPWQRTVIKDEETAAMGVLLNAIRRFKRILVPVIIDDCGNLIEGNRRVAAARYLIGEGDLPKDFTIPCYVIKSDTHTSGEIFAYINRARQQINSNVFLEIYNKNNDAVIDEKKGEAAYFESIMGGPEKLTKFIKAGGKATYLKPIKALVPLTGLDSYTVGMWLARYNLVYKTKRLLKVFDQKTLTSLIAQNKSPYI
jgi:hypothetical protein